MGGATADRTATTSAANQPGAGLPGRSPRMVEWFCWYGRRYVAKRFHAVRLSRGGFRPAPGSPPGPVVVVLNHPSWWDPMLGLVLFDFWPDRFHVAPIDSAALVKYKFFERLGFFGIEPGTSRGAREFLRRSLQALEDPACMLWLTGQGRFADVRERPVRLKEGIGHLACRLGGGTILPLAVEFTFWDESTPEAFARFGTPIALGAEGRLSPAAWTERVGRAVEEAQDALALDVIARDPARFETLMVGGSGVGGAYDLWRRLKAAVRGEKFDSGHGDV